MARKTKHSLWQARIDPIELSQQKLSHLEAFESYIQNESTDSTRLNSKSLFWNTEYINK